MLASKLIIQADIHQIVFRKGDNEFPLEPFVYVTRDDAKVIKAIGEHPSNKDELDRVDLFSEPTVEFPYGDALGEVLKFGASKVSGRFALMKPSAHITVSRPLSLYLRGFASPVFYHAVRFSLQIESLTIQTFA